MDISYNIIDNRNVTVNAVGGPQGIGIAVNSLQTQNGQGVTISYNKIFNMPGIAINTVGINYADISHNEIIAGPNAAFPIEVQNQVSTPAVIGCSVSDNTIIANVTGCNTRLIVFYHVTDSFVKNNIGYGCSGTTLFIAEGHSIPYCNGNTFAGNVVMAGSSATNIEVSSASEQAYISLDGGIEAVGIWNVVADMGVNYNIASPFTNSTSTPPNAIYLFGNVTGVTSSALPTTYTDYQAFDFTYYIYATGGNNGTIGLGLNGSVHASVPYISTIENFYIVPAGSLINFEGISPTSVTVIVAQG